MFDNIRKRFNKARNKIKNANRSSTSTQDANKAVGDIAGYEKLSWLIPFINLRKTKSNVDDNIYVNSEFDEDDLDNDLADFHCSLIRIEVVFQLRLQLFRVFLLPPFPFEKFLIAFSVSRIILQPSDLIELLSESKSSRWVGSRWVGSRWVGSPRRKLQKIMQANTGLYNRFYCFYVCAAWFSKNAPSCLP